MKGQGWKGRSEGKEKNKEKMEKEQMQRGK